MRRKTKSCLNALCFVVLLSLICISQFLFAQEPLQDRVARAVDASETTTLMGNVHPLARAEFDQGRVEPSRPMRVTMVFKMTPAQQADLNALLAAQQDRGSPDYHRWLTPEQFGSRFGLSQGDINKVTTWLESAGFHVESIAASQNMITFTGTAQQVEAALRTEIHRYVAEGKEHFANASEPSIPAALADVTLGFRGLNSFPMKPRVVRKMNPRFTSAVSQNTFIAPPDFATIYDVKPLYQQKGITGMGQKIAVVGQSDISRSDWTAFRTNSSNCANCPQLSTNSSLLQIVYVTSNPGMQQGDIDEANLDVEWAGAIAYNATVIFIVGNPVSGGGVVDALNYAIAPPSGTPIPAPIISTSYGDCEPDFSASGISSLEALMQQANAEGITVLGPAGDTGAADCDFNSNPSSPTTVSVKGLAVDLPGALEAVTSVGGTKFNEGTGVYWSGAVGTDAISSALSYIPETAWNDTNVTPQGATVSVGLAAGGGGSSTTVPKPAWQTGTGVPNDGARDVPDISFSASQLHDGYLICSENFNASANPQFTPTCVSPFGFRDTAGGNLAVVGGTSVGPPVMASIVALINEFTNSNGSGNINRVLYPLAARVPNAFHDVQTGNNQVPFAPPCVAQTQIGYSALAGYDLATGLGSIDAFVLVSNWTSVSPASTANAATNVDFSLAFTATQLNVKRGTCGSGTVALTRLNGFNGTPSFTCTVPTALGSTTCAVVPAGTAGFGAPRDYRILGWWGVMSVISAALILVGASLGRPRPADHKSRSWPRLVPGFALMTLVAVLMIGCGSKSSNNNTNPVLNYAFAVQVPSTAPVASGTVVVNAAIGGINHSAQITVTTQ